MSDPTTLSWRSLIHHLHNDQIRNLDRLEGRGTPAIELLGAAREYVRTNQLAELYRHVPRPPGVVRVTNWEEGPAGPRRFFSTPPRVIELGGRTDIFVTLDGIQYPDGHVDPEVFVDMNEVRLTPPQACELAAVLVGTAGEGEELASWHPGADQ